MQYNEMIDLLAQAKEAGETQTELVNDRLSEAFETWLEDQGLGEITDEEEHALRMAFEEGFGICMHGTGVMS